MEPESLLEFCGCGYGPRTEVNAMPFFLFKRDCQWGTSASTVSPFKQVREEEKNHSKTQQYLETNPSYHPTLQFIITS